MSSSAISVEQDGPVLRVTFTRPERRNAMTWDMYSSLHEACGVADGEDSVRLLLLRGSKGAFVAGTDITQFSEFENGEDGVAYERRIAEVVDRLEAVTVPTVAAVDGVCVGGGLVLAAACDLLVATRDATFGVPVARTLGNCLSMNSVSLLVARLGAPTVLDLLLRARMLSAEEAHDIRFVTELCDDATELDRTVEAIVHRLMEHAPLTMWASKLAVRRLRAAALPDGDDFVARTFGSDDFHRGVAAFAAKERVEWTGE